MDRSPRRRHQGKKKVVEPQRPEPALTEGELIEAVALSQAARVDADAAQPGLRKRLTRKVGGWMARRLQKRVEREWREYDHAPKVSFGPWRRRRSEQGGTQVYRSLVQIHFHPREKTPRVAR